MIEKIQLVVLVLALIDLTCSFLYISEFSKKNPNQDPSVIEANPILKKSIQTFGIKPGMILGGIITFGILILILFNIGTNGAWYLLGVYSMMLIYHILNFRLLKLI